MAASQKRKKRCSISHCWCTKEVEYRSRWQWLQETCLDLYKATPRHFCLRSLVARNSEFLLRLQWVVSVVAHCFVTCCSRPVLQELRIKVPWACCSTKNIWNTLKMRKWLEAIYSFLYIFEGWRLGSSSAASEPPAFSVVIKCHNLC